MATRRAICSKRCGGEQTWWCQKAQELGDQVKGGVREEAPRGSHRGQVSRKLDRCLVEVNKVLGFDSSNAEAQALQPQLPAEGGRPGGACPARGPSPKERRKGRAPGKASSDKLMARDFPGAVKDAHAALAQSPADKNTLMQAYRSLGYGYAYLNDKANAVKWLEKYCRSAPATATSAHLHRKVTH